ncbi:MAG: hypothetical protein ACTSRP_02525 [Candidatus Helarchaeota archaeon]
MRRLKSNLNLIICPKCGRKFDRMYARVTACGSCPSASFGDCGYIKCPFCSFEFPSSNNVYRYYK